jgi:predicted metal-dependent phosphoesterase TrpH
MLKVELHTHTSDDPIDPIPYSTFDLIDRAAELEYDALAITLHDRQLDVAMYAPYAASRGIVLIPGIERTIDGRHVLLLNFSRASEAVGSFDDLRALKSREQGLVIAPHPFFPAASALRGWTERHADVFDAVEYNAMFTRYVNFNILGKRWAARHGKPMVGNCDVHRLEMLGTTYSLIDAAPDPAAICAAVAEGRVTLVTNPLSMRTAARVMADLCTSNVAAPRNLPRAASAVQRPQPVDLLR